jgi:hypothetical protein
LTFAYLVKPEQAKLIPQKLIHDLSPRAEKPFVAAQAVIIAAQGVEIDRHVAAGLIAVD